MRTTAACSRFCGGWKDDEAIMTSGMQTAVGGPAQCAHDRGVRLGRFNVVDLLAHEVTTVTEVVDAEGVSVIDIDNTNGRVVVTGTDTDTITIVARVSDGLRATGNSSRVVDDRLEIRATCPLFGSMWCSVDYQIEVPAGIDLDINADDGRVEVVDVRGALTIDDDNGSIDIRGADGPLSATTDNGSIHATGVRSETVSIDSDNGSVEIVMVNAPRNLGGKRLTTDASTSCSDTPDAYAVEIDTTKASPQRVATPHRSLTITVSSDTATSPSATPMTTFPDFCFVARHAFDAAERGFREMMTARRCSGAQCRLGGRGDRARPAADP